MVSASPVIGYRAWRLDGDPGSPRLMAMYNDWAWNSQSPTRSVCAMLEGHSAPVDWCMCGLHGHFRLEYALADYLSGRNESVVGAVLGWGRVYLHDEGWRAEWAQPLALMYVGRTTQPIQSTAQLLGIPLVRQDAIEDYAVDYEKSVSMH